jgi:hypothetical protein
MPESDPRSALHEEFALVSRHLRVGWWSLLLFLSLGLLLEVLHGFKVGLYLDTSNHTRRLMWTLAHAHGTLLALVQIAFAVTVQHLPLWEARLRGFASACLIGAGILIPSGFFLGGMVAYAGDPGLGILLVPMGAVLLFLAVLLTARGLKATRSVPSRSSADVAKGNLGKARQR